MSSPNRLDGNDSPLGGSGHGSDRDSSQFDYSDSDGVRKSRDGLAVADGKGSRLSSSQEQRGSQQNKIQVLSSSEEDSEEDSESDPYDRLLDITVTANMYLPSRKRTNFVISREHSISYN